jgi:hypothetical protein
MKMGCAIAWRLFAAMLVTSSVAYSAEFSLWPQLQIAGAYDDNTDLTPTNRKGDFLTIQSPGATIEGSSSTRDFYLTYETLLLEHATYSKQDRFFQDNYFNVQDNERLNPDTTLSISETFLLGNSVGGGIITNNTVPLGTQVMQSLLSNSNTMGSTFAMNLVSRYSNSLTWTANVNQSTFSVLSVNRNPESANIDQNVFTNLSSNSVSKYNFSQGAGLAGDWNFSERLTAGAGYQFSDFRYSNTSVPTTESSTLAMRLGWGKGTPFSFLGQVGPVLSQSTSGKIGDVLQPAQTSIGVGFMVSGGYTGRRLTMTGAFSQAPGINNGLAGVATTQSYAGLMDYKLTRRTAIFFNGGYYSTAGTSSSSQVIAYTAGLSYVLNANLSANMNYVGYSAVANGLGASTLVSVPGRNTNTNLFIVGFTVHPEPLRWKW